MFCHQNDFSLVPPAEPGCGALVRLRASERLRRKLRMWEDGASCLGISKPVHAAPLGGFPVEKGNEFHTLSVITFTWAQMPADWFPSLIDVFGQIQFIKKCSSV